MVNAEAAIDCLREANTDELYRAVTTPVRAACKGMVPKNFEEAMANGLLIKIAARALAESIPSEWDNAEALVKAIDYAAQGLTLEFVSHFEIANGKYKVRRHG